jgi:hypothetical protein
MPVGNSTNESSIYTIRPLLPPDPLQASNPLQSLLSWLAGVVLGAFD